MRCPNLRIRARYGACICAFVRVLRVARICLCDARTRLLLGYDAEPVSVDAYARRGRECVDAHVIACSGYSRT
eukprot:3600872-Rhodomonas_salina.3